MKKVVVTILFLFVVLSFAKASDTVYIIISKQAPKSATIDFITTFNLLRTDSGELFGAKELWSVIEKTKRTNKIGARYSINKSGSIANLTLQFTNILFVDILNKYIEQQYRQYNPSDIDSLSGNAREAIHTAKQRLQDFKIWYMDVQHYILGSSFYAENTMISMLKVKRNVFYISDIKTKAALVRFKKILHNKIIYVVDEAARKDGKYWIKRCVLL